MPTISEITFGSTAPPSEPATPRWPMPSGSATTATTATSSVSQSTQRDSTGKGSSGQTTNIKRKQTDRLSRVKRTTLLVVILADLTLLGALTYQMLWLHSSLLEALQDRITDSMGFYHYVYNQQFTEMALSATLYSSSANQAVACSALSGDAAAQSEMQRRLGSDVRGRGIEIALVTDTAGVIMSTGGPKSALGARFNPHGTITDFAQKYPQTTQQLKCSVMMERDLFETLGAPVYAKSEDGPVLSWRNYTETLTRLVVTPLYCGQTQNQGYLILGHALTPSPFEPINRLVQATESAFVAVLARTSQGRWQTQYAFNHNSDTGQHGWRGPLSDPLLYFDGDFLREVTAQRTPRSGRQSIGTFKYSYAALPIARTQLGSEVIDGIMGADAVVVHAEPEYAVARTVNTLLLWHVPFGVFLILLSFVTLKFTYVKFIDPMRLLIDSVKKRQMKEFSDRIRRLKSSRSSMNSLLLKAVLVQGVLLGLVFANRHLLTSSIADFTSATVQGRIGPYVCSTGARLIISYLNAWAGFDSMLTNAVTRNVTDSFRADLQTGFQPMKADVIYLIAPYRPAEGRVFPEVGIMSYLRKQAPADRRTFTTLTNWPLDDVAALMPRAANFSDAPALIRLAVAPISYVSLNDGSVETGDLVGALVVLRVFNGLHLIYDWMVDAFGTGYYGIYEWDRFQQEFAAVTTILRTDTASDYETDVQDMYPDLLYNADAVFTSYAHDADAGILIRQGVRIAGQSTTVSVTPYFTADDVVLSPLMFNAYQVTAVPQQRYDDLLAHQLAVQIAIMAVEWAASIVALLCTYWPMKRFLDQLEKAFNVPSMSEAKRAKMEEMAAAMVTRPDPRTKPETMKPDGTPHATHQLSLPGFITNRQIKQ